MAHTLGAKEAQAPARISQPLFSLGQVMVGLPMHVTTPDRRDDVKRVITVVRSGSDHFFTAPVDALVHVPFARTTFDTDLTEQCELHLPHAMREWSALRQNTTDDRILVTSSRSAVHGPRHLLHLPLVHNWEEIPSLEWTHDAFVALATEVSTRKLRSVAFYGLKFPALSGETLIGYLRGAFSGCECKVYVFDRGMPTLQR